MPRKVENIEIWRGANQLIKRYGENAGLEAAQRADAALELGDRFNFNIWTRIVNAIGQLQQPKPTDQGH